MHWMPKSSSSPFSRNKSILLPPSKLPGWDGEPGALRNDGRVTG